MFIKGSEFMATNSSWVASYLLFNSPQLVESVRFVLVAQPPSNHLSKYHKSENVSSSTQIKAIHGH